MLGTKERGFFRAEDEGVCWRWRTDETVGWWASRSWMLRCCGGGLLCGDGECRWSSGWKYVSGAALPSSDRWLWPTWKVGAEKGAGDVLRRRGSDEGEGERARALSRELESELEPSRESGIRLGRVRTPAGGGGVRRVLVALCTESGEQTVWGEGGVVAQAEQLQSVARDKDAVVGFAREVGDTAHRAVVLMRKRAQASSQQQHSTQHNTTQHSHHPPPTLPLGLSSWQP